MAKRVGWFLSLLWGLAAFLLGKHMLAAYEQQQLWQYEALFLLLCIWLVINSLYFQFSKDKRTTLKGIGLSCLMGGLLTVGFSPFSYPITIFIGLVPLLYLLEQPFEKGRFFYIFSGLYLWNILATFWVANTSLGAGIFANLANAGLSMIPIALFWFLKQQFGSKFKWVLLVSLWISWEWFHMQWDLSWPWLNLGNAFGMAPSWVQWYEWTGIFGGSLWVWTVNILIYIALKNYTTDNNFKAWIKPLVALLFPVVLTMYLHNFRNLEINNQFKALIIQPNYEPHFEKFSISDEDQSTAIQSLIESKLDSTYDYLVLPETVFSRFDVNTPSTSRGMRMLESFAKHYPDLTIVGGAAAYQIFDKPVAGEKALRASKQNGRDIWYVIYNAAFSLNQEQGYDWYYKSKLVPGAEIFPFRELFFFAKPIVKSVGGSFEGHGTQPERHVFEQAATVAPVICYESVYGEYMSDYIKKGADAIFVLTNDGWWGHTPGHIQHLGFSRLRAIEFRKTVLRAANTGISCWIDPFGKVEQATAYDEAATVSATVLAYDTMTFYARYGDIIAKICLLLAIMFGFGGIAKRLQGNK